MEPVFPRDPIHGRSGGKAGILVVILAILGVAAYVGLWKGSGTVTRIVVPKGAAAQTIARELKDARLIGSKSAFLAWVKIAGARSALRPGVYMLSPGWSGFKIARQLRHGPELVRITFPEGWTAKQMAAALENKGVITDPAAFLALVGKDQREGFLFPDTYFFEQGVEPELVISRMIQRFHQEEPKDMVAQAKALKLSYRQVVVLASLVEREARVPQERPVIAGVFYNRLRKRWRLESCATVEYARGEWKPVLRYKDLEIESPYNTYKHAGLPPGPICNPGKAALEAAAHPAVTDMMFFVADGKGTHRFTQYYQEHLAVQKKKK
jgi:UPF0755 protein